MTEKDIQEQVKALSQEIMSTVKGRLKDGSAVDGTVVSLCANLLVKAGTYFYPFGVTIESLKDQLDYRVLPLVEEKLTEDVFHELIEKTYKYGYEAMEETMLHPYVEDTGTETPAFITKLAAKLLDMENPDPDEFEYVADFGCGKGNFVLDYNLMYPSQNDIAAPSRMFNAYDLNAEATAIAAMKANYLMKEYPEKYNRLMDFVKYDVLKLYCNEYCSAGRTMYDKMFAHHDWPKGKKRSFWMMSDYALEYVEKFIAQDGEIKEFMQTSPEWIMNHLMMQYLKDNGKAVVLMSAGSMVNKSDKAMRDIFVKNGWIERVIKLPTKLFANSNEQVYMLLLSKHNEAIRFLDASGFVTEGRRHNELSEADIDAIANFSWMADKMNTRLVLKNNDDVLANSSILAAERYYGHLEDGNDSEITLADASLDKQDDCFDSYINNIKRGAPLSADKLDELDSKEPTEYNYLRLKDLVNNDIPEDLPYLKELKPNLEKYLLNDGDLVISKSAKPFKVAVANIANEKKILPVGSMYAMELDKTKVNPYYLQAFFESKKGYDLIVNASAGTVVTMIPLDMLKGIKLDLPGKEEQDAKVLEYLRVKERIASLRRQLAEAEIEAAHILD